MSSPIHDKTIRPGSLNGYYYYSGGRKPVAQPMPLPIKERHSHRKLLLVLVLALAVGGWFMFGKNDKNGSNASQQPAVVQADQKKPEKSSASTATPIQKSVNYCKDNSLDNFIRISVEKRRLWACEAGKKVYETPVITGLRGHPETETPAGTYKIYGKMTNTTLTGSDSRGTWSDPVYYWMPFLDNQYGTYGFHDATWRAADVFGKISPDSVDASHGCVELGLGASKWLYEWAPVGTTVTVES